MLIILIVQYWSSSQLTQICVIITSHPHLKMPNNYFAAIDAPAICRSQSIRRQGTMRNPAQWLNQLGRKVHNLVNKLILFCHWISPMCGGKINSTTITSPLSQWLSWYVQSMFRGCFLKMDHAMSQQWPYFEFFFVFFWRLLLALKEVPYSQDNKLFSFCMGLINKSKTKKICFHC